MINKSIKYKFKFKSSIIRRILLFVFFISISLQSFSQSSVYVLKAVYLEKFSRFVTWPEECAMD
ncbi:MAG: hypothetical protein KAQ75_03705, partial [Bacteroidales bacterium]|nr:hypothetical protein [Bacteroidales bacterium]